MSEEPLIRIVIRVLARDQGVTETEIGVFLDKTVEEKHLTELGPTATDDEEGRQEEDD